eukprot:gene3541-biopygen11274
MSGTRPGCVHGRFSLAPAQGDAVGGGHARDLHVRLRHHVVGVIERHRAGRRRAGDLELGAQRAAEGA